MSREREDIDIAEAARATTWQPGVRIDKFTLVGKIATGGMAEIWLARQAGPRGFEKLVVIKKILDSFTNDDGFINMFLDEARTAALLTHPNIVQIYDLGEFERSYFIAMEFVAGEHLGRVAKASTRLGKLIPFAHAARMVADAAHGLHYAHTKTGTDGKPLNIVHRDVSPQNLMLTYDGVVKVLDFGVAKAANRSTHTEAGKFKGKIAYMSPEVARAEPFDARADVFALGIILYEMLGRCRLFDFDDPVEGVLEVSKREPPIPPVKVKNPEVPHELSAIVAKALERDQNVRYKTAKELTFALEDWLKRQPNAPESAQLAQFMQELFKERIDKQNKVIQEIRESPSGVIPLKATPTGEISMPGSQSGTALTAKKVVPMAALGLGALAVLAGVFVFGQSKNEGAVTPPVVAETLLTIESDPPGAALELDGHKIGTAPAMVKEISVGAHKVRATLEGFEPNDVAVKIARAGERTTVVVTLKELAGTTVGVDDAGVTTVQIAPPDNPVKTPKIVPRGRLSLNTVPWSEVYLGGRKLGDTPLVNISLPAGTHTLRLYNPDRKIEKSVSVEIKAGATLKRNEKL